MLSSTHQNLLRQTFANPHASAADAAHARSMLRILLAQDGSTTRLCETIAGQAVSLHVLSQRTVHTCPEPVHEQLPGTAFIERITCLATQGQVMMDNIVYVALDGLPASLRDDIETGKAPMGHLLARLWVRRAFFPQAPFLLERLWSEVGQPDPAASRAYQVNTPEGPRMLIAETYRRAMLL